MNYGLLLAALKPRDGESICLVRGLQSTQSSIEAEPHYFLHPSVHIIKSVFQFYMSVVRHASLSRKP